MENKYFKSAVQKLNSIIVYRNILNNKIISSAKEISKDLSDGDSNAEEKIGDFIYMLVCEAEQNGFYKNIFGEYIAALILNDENIFSLQCEKNLESEGTLSFFAERDVKNLISIGESFIDELSKKSEQFKEMLYHISSYKPTKQIKQYNPQSFEEITQYYKNFGCGQMASCKMFKYDKEKGLQGVQKPDPVELNDIIGYSYQKEQLLSNTTAFLNGYAANNALLIGSRGTGKSSCVKALGNMFFDKGLRIVEITKEQISEIPALIKILSSRGKKFIIYLDDLSFESHEIQYKHLKSLLEGGTEIKPDNVLFYATSNRRNIIQETWGDRIKNSNDEEVHTTDTQNEKLALADRFGITIFFPKPSPKQYIEIVKGIASKAGLNIPAEALEKEALKWDLQKAMSGRAARQFVNHTISDLKNGKYITTDDSE